LLAGDRREKKGERKGRETAVILNTALLPPRKKSKRTYAKHFCPLPFRKKGKRKRKEEGRHLDHARRSGHLSLGREGGKEKDSTVTASAELPSDWGGKRKGRRQGK